MRWRRLFILAATVALLALFGGAIGGFVWLKNYAPLRQGGGYGPDPNLQAAAIVNPVVGSGGKMVIFPRLSSDHDYYVGFDVTNDGPLDVEILGADSRGIDPGAALYPRRLRGRDHSRSGRVKIPSHSVRYVYVGFRTAPCAHREGFISTDRVWLRFRYARFFTRSEEVELPVALTLSCTGRYPRSTPTFYKFAASVRTSRSRAARAAAERADARPARAHPDLRRARPRL